MIREEMKSRRDVYEQDALSWVLYQNKKYDEAAQVFRADLDRNPRNPRSLFGLLETLKAQNKLADADWIRPELEKAWKDADVQLRMKDL